MIFIDLLVYLAIAKAVVLMLEDGSYAVRGKRSPRQQRRDRERTAAAAGQAAPARTGGWERATGAVGDYLGGLVEDATAGARARRRRAVARRRGQKAVDGMFVNLDDSGDGFRADCDLCGWVSPRRYLVEANALAAGREHTRTEHPEAYHEDPPTDDDGQADPGQAEPAGNPAAGDTSEQAGERPRLRVIPGGAQDPDPQAPQAPPVVHDQHDYCVTACSEGCPRNQPRWGWACGRCGRRVEGYPSEEAAKAGNATHTCEPPAGNTPAPGGTGPAGQPQAAAPPAGGEDGGPQTAEEWDREREAIKASARELLLAQRRCVHWNTDTRRFCGTPADDDVEDAVMCRYHRVGQLMQQLADNGRCIQPGRGPEGLCGQPVEQGSQACPQHRGGPNRVDTAGPASTAGAGGAVSLEATGPQEIRAAFGQAAEHAGGTAEDLAGLAAVLGEAADRYAGMEMTETTVERLRDAAQAVAAAKADLDRAHEALQAALADFNAKDGQVADAAADAGNLAAGEVLVGGAS
jgi:hypothetical protein